MTTAEYQELLMNTANRDWIGIERRLASIRMLDLLHAQLGITTEAGEFADALKRYFIYGKGLDKANLIEELGDLTWYIGLAIQAIGTTWGEVFETNIKKLAARYPEKFTEYHAINRNLAKEREILEENI